MSTRHVERTSVAVLAAGGHLAEVEPWTLQIDRPSAGWLNANERLHWATRARRTEVLGRLAFLKARRAGLPQLKGAHVVLWFRWADGRRRDVGNLAPTAKAIVDGLVKAHLLPDDDDTRLLGPDLRTGERLPAGSRPLVQVLIYPLDLAAVSGTDAPPPRTRALREADR